jgi:hypothetical protein
VPPSRAAYLLTCQRLWAAFLGGIVAIAAIVTLVAETTSALPAALPAGLAAAAGAGAIVGVLAIERVFAATPPADDEAAVATTTTRSCWCPSAAPRPPDDVIPFMENVTRGAHIPRERLEEVSQHYFEFGGRSPINDQNRALKAALEELLAAEGPTCRSTGATATGTRCCPTRCAQMRDDGVAPGDLLRHLGVLVVLGLPAVPGEPRRGAGRGR